MLNRADRMETSNDRTTMYNIQIDLREMRKIGKLECQNRASPLIEIPLDDILYLA